ncbi:MAG: ABC transporter ATP-binding protein, partial [Clostridiales bacterium]|nr:ABC transporter ATP-binding protein [Clostridiales bacterium]
METKNLCKDYRLGKGNVNRVLKNIGLQVAEGEFVSVMGPSGSGKSTLLYCISGMDRPTSGSVELGGMEIAKLSEDALAELRLRKPGFIFQQIRLLQNLSVLDNIILAEHLAGKNRGMVRQKALSLLRKTGISDLRDNDISQASDGQLQRAAICRAPMNDPAILFGDEPTGALNRASASEIMDLLEEVNRNGTAVFLVTHDAKIAARSQRVLCMADGRIVGEMVLGKYGEQGECGKCGGHGEYGKCGEHGEQVEHRECGKCGEHGKCGESEKAAGRLIAR